MPLIALLAEHSPLGSVKNLQLGSTRERLTYVIVNVRALSSTQIINLSKPISETFPPPQLKFDYLSQNVVR